MTLPDDYKIDQPSEANKTEARELLKRFHAKKREIITLEHREGNIVRIYETTPGRLESLINRLSQTGEAKILNK